MRERRLAGVEQAAATIRRFVVSRSKSWAALAAALFVALTASLAGPSDARADRCNPDEMAGPAYKLITGDDYEPVFGEDQGPFCYVMKTVVYPAVGCDPVYQSLQDCVLAQPGRALTIASGTCRATLVEAYQLYFAAAPYRVRQVVGPILDFFSKEITC
jgi:hypothetical protein